MAILRGARVKGTIAIDASTMEVFLKMLYLTAPHALPPVEPVVPVAAVPPPAAKAAKSAKAAKAKQATKKTDESLKKALEIVDEMGYPWLKKYLRDRFAAGDRTMVDRLIHQKATCKRGLGKLDWRQNKVYCKK